MRLLETPVPYQGVELDGGLLAVGAVLVGLVAYLARRVIWHYVRRWLP